MEAQTSAAEAVDLKAHVAEIVSSYVSRNQIAPADLAAVITSRLRGAKIAREPRRTGAHSDASGADPTVGQPRSRGLPGVWSPGKDVGEASFGDPPPESKRVQGSVELAA